MDETEIIKAMFGRAPADILKEAQDASDDMMKAHIMSANALESIADSLKRIVAILESK